MRQPSIAERFSLGASIDKDNGGGHEGGGTYSSRQVLGRGYRRATGLEYFMRTLFFRNKTTETWEKNHRQ